MKKADLQNEIQIVESSSNTCVPFWRVICDSLRHDIITKNPEDFLSFPSIQQTMFVGNAEYCIPEYEAIVKAGLSDRLIDVNPFTVNHQSNIDSKTTGNTIHHLFHLYQLIQKYGIDFSTLNHITELGGGYGNMARLCYEMGFRGTYQIIDLPEFRLLQRYYLSNLGINNVVWSNHALQPSDLFIATWSLSELPLQERYIYLHLKAKYFLMAFGDSFENINNIHWFQTMQKAYQNVAWNCYPFPFLDKQYYMLGVQYK